jgi:hypothetical protein
VALRGVLYFDKTSRLPTSTRTAAEASAASRVRAALLTDSLNVAYSALDAVAWKTRKPNEASESWDILLVSAMPKERQTEYRTRLQETQPTIRRRT